MTRPNPKKIYGITIYAAANSGFVITIGCETFVFPDTPEGLRDLADQLIVYLSDPKEVSLKFQAAKNKLVEEIDQPTDPAPPIYGSSC